MVEIAIYEVVDDFNLLAHLELLDRALLQIIRDRRHTVTLFDSVFCDRKIRTVGAHNGDVRAVQRGDKRQLARLDRRREHLPRQQRADRMRDRVMHVQNVEAVNLRDFSHARG